MASSQAISQLVTTIEVTNIHCKSCVVLIDQTLAALKPPPASHSAAVNSGQVVIHHPSGLTSRSIVNALLLAGFEVDRCDTEYPDGDTVELVPSRSRDWLDQIGNSIDRTFATRKRKVHLESCLACQELKAGKKLSRDSSVYSDKHGERKSILARMEETSDAAPSSELDVVVHTPEGNKDDLWQASISIRGMTCSSCVNTIRDGLKSFKCIEKSEVSALTHGGTVVFRGKDNAAKITEHIDDMGYDSELLEVNPYDEGAFESKERTMCLRVHGIHCPSCPPRIMAVFDSFPSTQISIIRELSEKIPTILYRYTPQPDVTTRLVIERISNIDSAFTVTVQNAETIEERSADVHQAELRRIAIRLALCVIVAIPTFIIGIVLMSLLPGTHPLRHWAMEPMWVGTVTRAEWAMFIMATPVYFFAADLFHVRAYTELRALWSRKNTKAVWKRFAKFGSMNLLMSLGTSIAYFSSLALLVIDARSKPPKMADDTYFDAVVFLTMFLLVGRVLESYSKAKSANAVSLLGQLRPSEAFLITESTGEVGSPEYNVVSRQSVAVELLEVGDLVQVGHGQSPPSDGKITTGETKFDESSLTGESRMIPKSPGDSVFTGTINHGGVITVQISSVVGKSMLDQIVQVVREGQAQRAPIERIADVVTSYFVPVISYLAVITWIIWLGVGYAGSLPEKWLNNNHGGWAVWSMSFAIAVFVIACPCGIGLAAPTALFIGTGLAAKYGILAKGGGEAFQEASQLDAIVFDKTGTLTEGGEPKITDFDIGLPDEGKMFLYSIVEALENVSSHPLAKAMLAHTRDQEKLPVEGRNLEEVPGRGIRGTFTIYGAIVDAIIGNESFMTELGVEISPATLQTLENWKREAKSVILLAITDITGADFEDLPPSSPRLVAIFAAADKIRSEAPFVIRSLHKSGIETYLLSGDNITTALAVGASVGIPSSNVIAGVLPTEKAEKIKYLQSAAPTRPSPWYRRKRTSRPRIAMVGDGINDAPALTTADVGIAIGSGADVALSSASFILLNSNLDQILLLTDLSKMVMRRVKFNFFWAGVYNLIGIPVAAGVIYPYKETRLNPAWAALAMALSSVSVVGSSLLLKSGWWGVGFRPRRKEMVEGGAE